MPDIFYVFTRLKQTYKVSLNVPAVGGGGGGAGLMTDPGSPVNDAVVALPGGGGGGSI